MLTLSFKQQKWMGILFICMSMKVFINSLQVGIGIPFLLELPLSIAVYALVFKHIYREKLFENNIYLIYFAYLLYIGVQFIYGFFNAYNYWQYKSLIYNTFTLLLPFFALFFSNPSNNIGVLRTWNKLLYPWYIVFLLFALTLSRLHLILGPAYFFYGVFIFLLPRKWQYITGAVLLLMLVADIGARAQVVKALFTILLAFSIFFRNFISLFVVRFFHCFFYFIAILFFILGLTGVYNVFSPEVFDGERTIQPNSVYGQDEHDEHEVESLTVDTRTMIYVESITSAINNNYVIFGRSPARGNDTESFSYLSEEFDSRFVERDKNELCHLNVFTWTGLVGVLLYSFFYIQSSFLALYRSRNIYVKYLSLMVSFHWAFGWVEDCNAFDMMNVGLWLVIGLCLSPKIRLMSDMEFELWFKSIFCEERVSPYVRYLLGKETAFIKKYNTK